MPTVSLPSIWYSTHASLGRLQGQQLGGGKGDRDQAVQGCRRCSQARWRQVYRLLGSRELQASPGATPL